MIVTDLEMAAEPAKVRLRPIQKQKSLLIILDFLVSGGAAGAEPRGRESRQGAVHHYTTIFK